MLKNKMLLFKKATKIEIYSEHIPIILGTISLMMCILNFFYYERLLFISTGIYGIINIFLGLFAQKRKMHNSSIIKTFEAFLSIILLLFLFITGIPEGFSAIWLLIVPITSPMFLGLELGFFYSVLPLLIVMLLCWTPLGSIIGLYAYSEVFLLRFPFAFFGFCLLGMGHELINDTNKRNLEKLKTKYEYLSTHDSLTKIYNRQAWIQDYNEYTFPLTLLLYDIDSFKKINDNFGHLAGDNVLIAFSTFLSDYFKNCKVYRWGGDEFMVIIQKKITIEEVKKLCGKSLEQVRKIKINTNRQVLQFSVSAGGIITKKRLNIEEFIDKVDKKAYKAKLSGKNKFEIGEIFE